MRSSDVIVNGFTRLSMALSASGMVTEMLFTTDSPREAKNRLANLLRTDFIVHFPIILLGRSRLQITADPCATTTCKAAAATGFFDGDSTRGLARLAIASRIRIIR
jgi:hypothetical protein